MIPSLLRHFFFFKLMSCIENDGIISSLGTPVVHGDHMTSAFSMTEKVHYEMGWSSF